MIDRKEKTLIQFWIDREDKERADRVIDHYGEISHLARTGFLSQVEKKERELRTSEQSQIEKAS